jgi:hypothetical protein
MKIETIKLIVELIFGSGLFGILWKANRVVNKWWDLVHEYPPHRHVDEDTIQYPVGLEPGKTAKMSAGKNVAARV